jgi:small subunit ribosomal protein S9
MMRLNRLRPVLFKTRSCLKSHLSFRQYNPSPAPCLQSHFSKYFSTSLPRHASDEPTQERAVDGFSRLPPGLRLIPASPSYFTAKPDFTDHLLQLQDLARRYQALPTLEGGEVTRVAWKSLAQYRMYVGEPVKASKYRRIVTLLQRLNRIHPALMPDEVRYGLEAFKREGSMAQQARPLRELDADGRSYGVGRRKTSTARVWLVEGDGEVLINGKPLPDTFGRLHDRESAIWPLKITTRVHRYNIWGLVEGGGSTGQAEALTLALANALLVHEPDLKPALRRGMFFFSILCGEPICSGSFCYSLRLSGLWYCRWSFNLWVCPLFAKKLLD